MTVQAPAPTFRPAQRISAIGVSEILKIGAVAQRLKREGRPVIVLGAGEPDFDTPDHAKDAAERAIRAGQTKYTILDGTVELKAAIAEKFRRENDLVYAADEITAGAGAKQVIHNAFMATLSPGDEVILAAPYWTSYADMVRIADGTPVDVLCREESGFRLDAADLERAITPKTRWLLLNSPSNPTGAAYSAEQLRPILDVLKRHPHAWLMADDIYEHLIYDGMPFVTAAALEPSLKSRTLTVNGVSKAYAMTGWRVGYGGGPRELIAAMAVVQSQSTTNPSSVSQAAAIAALTGPQGILIERRTAFQPPGHRGRCAQCHRRRHLPPAGRCVLHLCQLCRPDRPPYA
ncbi:aspartate aminotransferase [Bradyrhizobium barranii subsp. barranii]